jgi:hypothetical protein
VNVTQLVMADNPAEQDSITFPQAGWPSQRSSKENGQPVTLFKGKNHYFWLQPPHASKLMVEQQQDSSSSAG